MIYFIRHGETNFNDEGRCTGQIDVALNKKGISQAHELAEKLRNLKFSKIFCSPLKRAKQTAEIINENYNVPIVIIDNLKERNDGTRQGVCYKNLSEKEDLDFFKSPEKYGAESNDQFFNRCVNAYKEIKGFNEDVLIVSHGGVFRAFCCHLTGNSEMLSESWRLKNCEIAIIDEGTITKNPIIN